MNEAAIDPAERQATIAMVWLSAVASAMMLSAVNVALPGIASDLGLDAVMLSWVPMSYLLASAASVLACGRLADQFGRRRLFLLGTALSVLASLGGAAAADATGLIAARLLQGVAAAMLFATQLAIVSAVYPPARRGAAIGYTVSAIYLGLALGPLVAGWLVAHHSWRATFLLHVPMGVVVLWIGTQRLHHEWRASERVPFDFRGSVIYAVAIVLFMLGLARLPTPTGALLLAAGTGGLWLFFRHAHGHPHPVFDVGLFYSNRVFTLSCLTALVMYTATFANIVLVSLYLQYLKGVDAATAGMVMMAQPLVMTGLSPLAGRLSDRVEPRVIASAGLLLTAGALFAMAGLDAASQLTTTVACLALSGVGFSLFSSPNANAIMAAVERSAYAQASSAMSVMRVLGQLTSMGLVALMFALLLGPVAITPAVYPQLGRAIALSFAVGGALCLAATALSLARGVVHTRTP